MADDPNTLAPLVPQDEPVQEPQKDEAPPQPAEGEQPASPPAEPGEGISQDKQPTEEPPKAEPEKPQKSAREKLIAKLTGEEDEPPPKDDEAPQPPAEPEPKAEKPTGEEQPKPPEPAPTEDDSELTNETAAKLKPGEVRRKINRLLQRVKASEPLAKGYQEIIEVCEKNGFAPDDYRAWVALGIGLQQGNPQALQHLATIAQKAGAVPASAPASMSEELETWLKAQEKDLEISATAAAELRKRLGTPKPAPAPAPQPAPQQPAAPPPAPVPDSRARATQEINRIADETEKRIGAERFKELEPRVMAAIGKYKGSHPDAWPAIFRAAVEAELARAPKPALPNPSLRPGASSAPASQPQFKSERERVIHQYTG